MEEAYKHCEALVRERDRERFLANLFAPADKRPYLFAIHAFDLEIAHIPDAVRELMAGEIRLQWWREALAGERVEEARANPVAAALNDTIKQHDLSFQELTGMIGARRFDLLGEPMQSRGELEKYLDTVFGVVLRHAAQVLDRAGETGTGLAPASRAIGMMQILRNLPRDISRGRLFVPLDLLAAHDVHTASVMAGEYSGGFRAALGEMRQWIVGYLAEYRAEGVPAAVLPAVLPLALVKLYLARMEKAGYDPFRSRMSVSGVRGQFALWRAAKSAAF